MKTEKEIEELYEKARDSVENFTTKFPGMTYEEGIRAAINWILEIREECPMEEK